MENCLKTKILSWNQPLFSSFFSDGRDTFAIGLSWIVFNPHRSCSPFFHFWVVLDRFGIIRLGINLKQLAYKRLDLFAMSCGHWSPVCWIRLNLRCFYADTLHQWKSFHQFLHQLVHSRPVVSDTMLLDYVYNSPASRNRRFGWGYNLCKRDIWKRNKINVMH